jgi:hypothetical protein
MSLNTLFPSIWLTAGVLALWGSLDLRQKYASLILRLGAERMADKQERHIRPPALSRQHGHRQCDATDKGHHPQVKHEPAARTEIAFCFAYGYPLQPNTKQRHTKAEDAGQKK